MTCTPSRRLTPTTASMIGAGGPPRPAGSVPAGPVQYPLADLGDHPGRLGHRDEVGRGDAAEYRMPPPQQRLRADRVALDEVEHRLVDEVQLAPGDHAGQVVFEGHAVHERG